MVSKKDFAMGSTEQFIGLYHELWDHLRQLTDSDHRVSFNDLIDKASNLNELVRSEARSLKDFGRLCNEIKNHRAYPREKIAEPTKKALSDFKRLVENIISPKSLIPKYQAEIKCFSPKDQLVTALRYMRDNDFSQIVIEEKGGLSLLTVEGLAKWLEQQAENDVITIAKVKISDALACDLPDTLEVMRPEDTIYDAQQTFKNSIEKNRPRLFAIIITDSGKRTGKPVGIVTPWDLTPEEAPSQDFVFRKQEDFWNIVFEGKSILLRDTKGLNYISHLLHNPGERIHVFALQAAAEGLQIDPAGKRYSKMTREQLEEYDLSISYGLGDAGITLDPQAISEYKEHYQSLIEDLEEAKEFNDYAKAANIQDETDKIKEQLIAALGLGGKSRKSADTREKVRKAGTNNIKYSLKKIQKEHRSLGRHLDESIETGTFCSYSPKKPIPWNF
jgi:CBS domain-containing protein